MNEESEYLSGLFITNIIMVRKCILFFSLINHEEKLGLSRFWINLTIKAAIEEVLHFLSFLLSVPES